MQLDGYHLVLTQPVSRYFPAASAVDGALLGAVPFAGHVSMKEWGDEWVVFDGASGACHLLRAACGAVLAELLHAPADGLDQLQLFLQAFGDEGGAPSDAEMATLQEALTQLRSLGLVRADE